METYADRQRTAQQWHAQFAYTIVEPGNEQLPLFQVALHSSFNAFEPAHPEWLNFYSEWQEDLTARGAGVYEFLDYPWTYEVKILTPEAMQEQWGTGWEAFELEDLIVGWQRNLTKSPDQYRPVRRIDHPVENFQQANLTKNDYDGGSTRAVAVAVYNRGWPLPVPVAVADYIRSGPGPPSP